MFVIIESVSNLLLKEFAKQTGLDESTVQVSAVHRWRYSYVPECVKESFLYDPNLGIALCGDWCGGPKVEGAFLSGLQLAEKIHSVLQS